MPGSTCGAAGGPGRGGRVARRGAFWVLLAVAALGLGGAVAAAGRPNVAVTDIEFEVIPASSSASRSTLGENQAILGDTVRVRAVVENLGDVSADVFDVAFYFVERTSQETGRIGTATVFGLAPGQTLKPAVSLDTASLAPGIYDIVVKADPGNTLDEDPADLCNNEVPRGACQGKAALEAATYSLALLREGPAITGLTLVDPFPTSRMGPLDLSSPVNVTFYNVGTVTLGFGSATADGYYRTSLSDPFPQEPNLPNLKLRILTSSVKSGEEGRMTIHLSQNDDFSELCGTVFSDPKTLGLGQSTLIQFRILVTPTSTSDGATTVGIPRELILPDKRTLTSFYSDVDLWTFPSRTIGPEAGSTLSVPAVVDPQGVIYQVVSRTDGDRLYALNANGEPLWQKDYPGERLTAAAMGPYDVSTASVVLYFGSDKGNLYALRSRRAHELETTLAPVVYVAEVPSGWTSAKSVGAMTSPPAVSDDGTRILGASASGFFLFDEDGNSKSSAPAGSAVADAVKKAGVVTPAFIDATREVWFAAGRTVYKLAEDGAALLCTHDAGSDVTALETNSGQTEVYVGTERGFLWALDVGTAKGQDCTGKRSIDLKNAVRGATAVREKGANRDLVFVTTDDGYVHRVTDSAGSALSDSRSKDALQLGTIKTAPAVLTSSGGKVAAVLVATRYGQLRAFSSYLDQVEKVRICGTSVDFAFDTDLQEAMTAPVVSLQDEIVYVGSADGYLYAFSLSELEY